MVQPHRKIVWQFLLELKMSLVYDPAIAHLGIYPREMKIYFHAETCPRTFTVLSLIAPNYKLSKYPSMGESFNQLWYMYNLEYLLAKKKEMNYRYIQATFRKLFTVKNPILKGHTLNYPIYIAFIN